MGNYKNFYSKQTKEMKLAMTKKSLL